MYKSLTAAVLTAMAVAASTGLATAAPIPAGPKALKGLTGLILPGPDNVTGSDVDNGSPMIHLEDTNGLNLMSDHSRTQVTGTSGNQG